MATNFPSSLDTFTNPSATDTLDSPPHDQQHANINDAVEALEAKVGVNSSAVTSSLDYKVGALESRPVETKTASYTLVADDVNKRIVMNNAGATTITVNDGVFAAGDTVWIHNIGAGTTTVTAGTATVNTAGSLDVGQWEGGSLYFTSASSAIFFRGGGAGVTADFLVIAGGGGGGSGNGSAGAGGAGAGGYRNSYNSESSGGGASAESSMTLAKGIAYPIIVGAGGTRASGSSDYGGPGSLSQFAWISTVGGGLGGSYHNDNQYTYTGGSGGGAGSFPLVIGGPGTVGQGYAGGNSNASVRGGGGGGGAGAAGTTATGSAGQAGGTGVASTITGSSVTRGGGGGGGGWKAAGGAGGAGGGGAGSNGNATATNGTANTGGGGGGGGGTDAASPDFGIAGNGGSGIVIFRVPSTITVTFSGGVTATEDTSTVPGTNIVTVTATSTISETVTFS